MVLLIVIGLKHVEASNYYEKQKASHVESKE
jgi:hypothetical protein